MGGGFTDYEKGDVAAEKAKLGQTKAAATTQQPATPLQSPAPSPTPSSQAEVYPLAPDASLENRLAQLVGQRDVSALGQIKAIRESMPKSVQAYLGFADIVTRERKRITEADILANLSPRLDVFHDVLFVSIRYSWNPDEVLALWESEGLPDWVRATTGTSVSYTPGAGMEWGWLQFPEAFRGLPLTKQQARTIARSYILFQYWGLDVLAAVRYNSQTQDNQLTSTDVKAHDTAFDTGFKKEISTILPNVTVATLRDSLTNDAIEFSENGSRFRLKPEYQATVLALQHARYKSVEAQMIKRSPLQLQNKTKVALAPPFPALIYLYFNSSHPDHNVELMSAGLKGKKSSYNSQELCQALETSELPKEVTTSLEACRKLNRLNCHGYMNALRFEFLRRVYEQLFQPTNIGAPRGCQKP